MEGDGDAVSRGLGAVDGGGCWLEGGGEGDIVWCVNGEGGDDGAVPMRGGWVAQEFGGAGGHGEEVCCRPMLVLVQIAVEVVSRGDGGRG